MILVPKATADIHIEASDIPGNGLLASDGYMHQGSVDFYDPERDLHTQVECWYFNLNAARFAYQAGDSAAPITEHGIRTSSWLEAATFRISELASGKTAISWVHHLTQGMFLLEYFGQPLELPRLIEL